MGLKARYKSDDTICQRNNNHRMTQVVTDDRLLDPLDPLVPTPSRQSSAGDHMEEDAPEDDPLDHRN